MKRVSGAFAKWKCVGFLYRKQGKDLSCKKRMSRCLKKKERYPVEWLLCYRHHHGSKLSLALTLCSSTKIKIIFEFSC